MKGISLTNPLGRNVNIPIQIEDERLLELTKKIRAGIETKEEHNEVAYGFIRLAIKIASRYAAYNKSRYADDFISCATFGIVKALSVAKEKLVDDNITPYICATIHSLCRRFIDSERIYGCPGRTRRKYREEGIDLPKEQEQPLETVEIRQKVKATTNMYDLKEIIYLSANDDIDIQIIEMRSQCYTDLEISEYLMCSNEYVRKRRIKIEERFNILNEE